MRHLIIRNIGPLREVDIVLNRFNVILGMQSSGKSCVLRIASYCAWVEKQIQLSQSSSMFEYGTSFMDILCGYHKMTEYLHEDSYISYDTDTMSFSYDHRFEHFDFEWKEGGHYKYRMPKIAYIPTERNIVSLLPNWKSEVTAYDCVLDFMKDWDKARRAIGKTSEIFNLRMNYFFNKSAEDDYIQLKNGKNLHLPNTSSGVQSLVPLFITIDYITQYIYLRETNDMFSNRTEAKREKINRLIDLLYAHIKRSQLEKASTGKYEEQVVRQKAREYLFKNQESADAFAKLMDNYLTYQHTDIYLEEPENNLFPSTQCMLMDWLDAKTRQHVNPTSIFIATHSPYVLTYLMDKNMRGKRFFFTYEDSKEEGVYRVKALTPKEIEQIVSGGVDVFYNYESYIE